MKRIHTAANLPEAQLVKDMLVHHGIAARLLNANAASVAGELPIEASLPQVWIDNDLHAARARELVAAYFAKRHHVGPPLRCPKCGEDNPSSFEICWACGTAL